MTIVWCQAINHTDTHKATIIPNIYPTITNNYTRTILMSNQTIYTIINYEGIVRNIIQGKRATINPSGIILAHPKSYRNS